MSPNNFSAVERKFDKDCLPSLTKGIDSGIGKSTNFAANNGELQAEIVDVKQQIDTAFKRPILDLGNSIKAKDSIGMQAAHALLDSGRNHWL